MRAAKLCKSCMACFMSLFYVLLQLLVVAAIILSFTINLIASFIVVVIPPLLTYCIVHETRTLSFTTLQYTAKMLSLKGTDQSRFHCVESI